MWDLMGYCVVKTTTDKLEHMLNGFSDGWTVQQITFTGGRDWVVIASQEFANNDDKAVYMAEVGA